MVFLYNFSKAQHNIFLVYLNLLDILLARKITVIKVLSLNLYADAKQGPAVTVIPVLIPMNPYLLKSLFVFCQ